MRKLFSDGFGSVFFGVTEARIGISEGDLLLKKEDKTPNRTGIYKLGFYPSELPKEKIRGLFLLGEDIGIEVAEKAEFLVVVSPYLSQIAQKAQVVFPSAHSVEQFGSYVNFDGRVQKTEKAIAAPGEAIPAYQILSRIGQKVSVKIPTCPAEIFKEISQDIDAFNGLSWQDLDPCGALTKA
mgnify:CR=1 FL=1